MGSLNQTPASACGDDAVLTLTFSLSLFFLSPQIPPAHSCVFLVVGPSSCGFWDATSAWPDERCHVCAQDPNRVKPWTAEVNLTTRPGASP